MPPEPSDHHIAVHLDRLLQQHDMTLTELADRVGITVVNLSVLKNGRARAIRFSTLAALCQALDCQPGELLSHQTEPLQAQQSRGPIRVDGPPQGSGAAAP